MPGYSKKGHPHVARQVRFVAFDSVYLFQRVLNVHETCSNRLRTRWNRSIRSASSLIVLSALGKGAIASRDNSLGHCDEPTF